MRAGIALQTPLMYVYITIDLYSDQQRTCTYSDERRFFGTRRQATKYLARMQAIEGKGEMRTRSAREMQKGDKTECILNR